MTTLLRVLSFGVLVSLAAIAEAKDVEYIQLRNDGVGTYFDIESEEEAPDEIVFYDVIRGNESRAFYFRANGPTGIRFKATIQPMKKSLQRELRRKGSKISLLTSSQAAERHSRCLDISVEGGTEENNNPTPAEFPPTWNEICEIQGRDNLAMLGVQMSTLYGGNWTPEHVCSYLTSKLPTDIEWDFGEDQGDGQTPPFLLSSASLRASSRGYDYSGVLSLNACKRASTKYLVKFTAKLSDVAPEDYEGGSTISARFRFFKHSGGEEASIKPESEGRYAPRPIVLMNYLGGTCGHLVEVVKWKKRKIAWRKTIEPYAILLWRDYLMTLTLADSVLGRGGKATFELQNRNSAYGVCFQLKRKRQRVNGYPK